jgi:hypothetical protein
MDFLITFNPILLPAPEPTVYLDGQYILYGMVDGALHWIADRVELLDAFFSNDISFALGAALLTNIFAYASAATVFYAAMVRLTGMITISALMAVGLFLAPQMLDINLVRVDFLITLPLMVIFYCSCVLAVGQEQTRHAVVLGLAMAFAATLKLNGPFFGLIPALAAVASYRFDRAAMRRLARFITISIAVFLPVYIILMGRYFYYYSPLGILQFYKDSIALIDKWAVISAEPPSYYHIDLMTESGLPFIALYLTCAAATVLLAFLQCCRRAIFLALVFVVFSAGAMLTMKYSRRGYHLLPIFFAVIGFPAAAVMHSAANRFLKAALATAGALTFALSIHTSHTKYQTVVAQRESEAVGVQALKREPRDWLLARIPLGIHICIQTDSEWTLPPLDGFKVIYGPLNLPYLDLLALANAQPPSLEALKQECPIVVTSDLHRNMYDSFLERVSIEAAAQWRDFFIALNQNYPPTVFSSAVPIYATAIEVNDLR